MAARIEVTQGPDEGLQVVFGATEVRIGRGAGCTLALSDDALAGQLRVGLERGTYVVKNELESPGWFLPAEDSPGQPEEFHPGQRRVWYHGSRIQPTARTVLALYIDEGLTVPDAGAEVGRSKPGVADKKTKDRVRIAVIVVLFAAAALLFAIDTSPVPQKSSPTEVRAAFDRVEKDLKGLGMIKPAAALRERIRRARYLEASERPADAFDEYVLARDMLNTELGPPGTTPDPTRTSPKAFEEAREFVNGRLVELSAAHDKVRGGR